MRTFTCTKSLQVIRDQCAAQGVHINDALLKRGDSDYVVLQGGGATVFFNTVNGTFFGTTPNGVKFDSSEVLHEQCDWFQQLLSFFYTNEERNDEKL